MNEFCDYCGNEIDGFQGFHSSLTRFCCEEHRINYHNQKRKIERKIMAIFNASRELIAMIDNPHMEGLQDHIYHQLLDSSLSLTVKGTFDDNGKPTTQFARVRCVKCKFETSEPTGSYRCPECQHDKFVFSRYL